LSRPDRGTDGLALVTVARRTPDAPGGRRVVGNDDVALPQDRGEKVFNIGPEARPIHRPIDDPGRGDLIVTQGGEEGHRLPMAVGHRREKALPAGRPAIEPDPICLCSCFIFRVSKEDKTFGVQNRAGSSATPGGLRRYRRGLVQGAQ
jgi:hypothetical protein